MNDPHSNQRLHKRRVLRARAAVNLDWGRLDGTIENIGEGGAFFVTETLEGAVFEGDSLTVVFGLPESEDTLTVTGRVLRVERYFHGGALYRAFAIRFAEPFRPGDA